MVKGYMKIEEIADVERALARMMNKCLMSDKCLEQAGRLASLANAFTAARRLRMELSDMERVDKKVDELLGRR